MGPGLPRSRTAAAETSRPSSRAVAARVAAVLGLTPPGVAAATGANAARVFGVRLASTEERL